MDSQRLKKIENTAKKILWEHLPQQLSDEENKLYRIVNIVDVKLSSDLSYLDVFVSCFWKEETLTKNLATHANNLERILFKELAMRKNPRIRFRYDDSGRTSSEIIETINSL